MNDDMKKNGLGHNDDLDIEELIRSIRDPYAQFSPRVSQPQPLPQEEQLPEEPTEEYPEPYEQECPEPYEIEPPMEEHQPWEESSPVYTEELSAGDWEGPDAPITEEPREKRSNILKIFEFFRRKNKQAQEQREHQKQIEESPVEQPVASEPVMFTSEEENIPMTAQDSDAPMASQQSESGEQVFTFQLEGNKQPKERGSSSVWESWDDSEGPDLITDLLTPPTPPEAEPVDQMSEPSEEEPEPEEEQETIFQEIQQQEENLPEEEPEEKESIKMITLRIPRSHQGDQEDSEEAFDFDADEDEASYANTDGETIEKRLIELGEETVLEEPSQEPEMAESVEETDDREDDEEEPDRNPEETADEHETPGDESQLQGQDVMVGLLQKAARKLKRMQHKRRSADNPVEDAEISKVIPIPQEKPNLLQKKLQEMEDRAQSFADSMFQGDSAESKEEEAEQQKVEQFIPGTDQEELPRKAVKEKRQKPPVRKAPDTSPKELGRIYRSSWKSGSSRLPFQLLLAVLLLLLTLAADAHSPGVLPILLENLKLTGILLALGLVGASALGLDTLLEGIVLLVRGKPGLQTLTSIGVFLTLIDALWYATIGREGPVPFCGFAALSLWAVAWGNVKKKQGLYKACEMAAAISNPQRVTLDQGKWSNKGTFIKGQGGLKGFGSQIQEMDGAQQIYRYAAPVMIIVCIVFGIFAAVGQKTIHQLIWNWSVIFVLAAPLSATLAYGQPYARQVKKLLRNGVILAGWDGAASMKGEAGICICDNDLFPEGTVQLNGISNFGQVSLEKLTGCTASMIREMDTGLAPLFDDQIRMQGGFYRRVDSLKCSEAGGFSGTIRGDQVMVGSADYMKVMGIELKQGMNVKNSVFCVINGELQGIFALNYILPQNVKPTLNELIRTGVTPILATRDFNLTTIMLSQRFHLPVDRMEYPPVDRRHQLSAKEQPHNNVLGALVFRDGLKNYANAIMGGRRLCSVVTINTIIAVVGSVVGALMGCYLTLMTAYQSLSPINILFFLLMWLVPNILVSGLADKF